jgi:hypothetical protein
MTDKLYRVWKEAVGSMLSYGVLLMGLRKNRSE